MDFLAFLSVAVHELGLPRKAKKGVPETLGRTAWKGLFWAYVEGFWPC